jgi:hypothetical protein
MLAVAMDMRRYRIGDDGEPVLLVRESCSVYVLCFFLVVAHVVLDTLASSDTY